MRSIMRDMRYHVFWSPEDGEWVATVEQFPSLSCLADTPGRALVDLVIIVEEEIRTMADAELGGES